MSSVAIFGPRNIIQPPVVGFQTFGGTMPGGTACYKNLQYNLPKPATRFWVASADSNMISQLIALSLQPITDNGFLGGGSAPGSQGPSPNGLTTALAAGMQGFFLQDTAGAAATTRVMVELCSPVSVIYLSWNMGSPSNQNRWTLGFGLAKSISKILG